MNILSFLVWDLKGSRAGYETEFRDELGDAFAGENRLRRRLTYAYGLYHEKRYPQALKLLERLDRRCRNDEDRRSVLLAMALCLEELERPDQAEEVYRTLAKLLPGYSTALNNLGLLLKNQGRFLEAEKYYLQAIGSGTKNGTARLNLGLLHFRRGQYEKAIPLLTEACDLLPKSRNGPGALARCYAALQDMDEAKRWAKLAVQRGRDESEMERAIWRTRNMFPDLSRFSPETAAAYRGWLARTGKTSLIMGITPNRAGRSYVAGEALGTPPSDPNGKPMRQLAAIFCEEFPGVGLPERGLIRIFIADDGSSLGMDPAAPNVQSGFRVLYDREFDHLTPGPQPVDPFPIRSRYWFALGTRVTQPMPVWDFRFEQEFGGDAREDLGRAITCEFHRIGGYPRIHGTDLRNEPGLEKYDQLLLQLDELIWNDRRICMKFCIPSEKLSAGDVSDVLYWWD